MTRPHSDPRREDVLALADTREQAVLDLHLRTERATLQVGDYSVKGLTHLIAVERKSIADLVMCCGRERARFQRCIERMRNHEVKLLVIEGTESQVLLKQYRSEISPLAVLGSVYSWMAKGIAVHWAGDRLNAARVVSNILYFAARERFHELSPMVGGLKLAPSPELKEGA